MKKRYKVDLHTHSTLSKDGGIRPDEYMALLDEGVLDVVAITDHNLFAVAQVLAANRPQQIIPGEEIKTEEGEVIGLYLKEWIAPRQSLQVTLEAIREQGGLVYIPHPFDPMRHGLTRQRVLDILPYIDILEGFNARYITQANKTGNEFVRRFGEKHNMVMTASSDAHGRAAIGKTYAWVSTMPTRRSLVQLLREADFEKQYASIPDRLVPGWNRLKKLMWMG